jgi:hypothetical protein
LADCDAGLSNDEVARKFSVTASWIRRLKQRRRETGSIDPHPRRSPTSRLLAYGPRICELAKCVWPLWRGSTGWQPGGAQNAAQLLNV